MRRLRATVALVITTLATACGGVACNMPTDAMKPTITREDMCMVNPSAYRTGEVQRFDLVIFEMPDSEKQRVNTKGGVRQIKRIVGMPGERLEVRENQLFINDVAIIEPFQTIVADSDKKRNFGPIAIPEGEYFLLGDNRPESLDSRYFNYPTVNMADIHGKVVEIKKGYYAKK